MRLFPHTLAAAFAVIIISPLQADEASAVAALKKLGAEFRVDVKAKGTPIVEVSLIAKKTGQDGIPFLKELPHLRRVHLENTPVAAEQFKLIGDLSNLEELGLYGTGLTPGGLKELVRLKKLRSLNVGFNRLTNESLREIQAWPDLEQLSFSNSRRITDAGLKYVNGLKKLRSLDLTTTSVTDAGLDGLTDLPELTELHLPLARVTDGGVKALARFPKLKRLDLYGTRITDAGLASLAKLGGLTYLGLSSTKITDEGLKHLTAAPKLWELDLSSTSITDAGVRILTASRSLGVVWVPRTKATEAGTANLKTASGRKLRVRFR